MTDKRFKLDDFDSEVEMWELLNIQAEVISDLEKENEQLRKDIKEKEEVIKFYHRFNKGVDDDL